ncbi:ABC transporter permease subunit [Micromonospora krabiensis]|uniref:ABC-2 type transport system permease protein n=1 Tax=Micromonospora krabiensis TaxID=307121 RepID=A0A1C3MWX1_9ACTN|nr:ABC transporter permease subunit [Micromonospora krabiensis]SBV24818.1 ABC-2 type transport system permease protein [Micromonospora krabiensis]
MPNVMTKTLWDSRRSLAGFAVGTALVGTMYAGFYSQVSDGAMGEAVEGFSPALREALNMEDIASAAGYLGSSVFGIIVPLIAVIYGIATGTRAIAGDEEAGYLDLLLAHPVSRTRLLLHRCAALAIGAFVLAALVLLAMLAIRSSAQLTTVSVGQFAAQCAALALLSTVFGAVAIAIGAATGSRAAALAGSATVGVLAYAASTFATQIGAGGLRYVSPFHYYIGNEPLRNGFQWADLGILAAAIAVLVLIAGTVFNRRDLTS